MIKERLQAGFSAVELLITLFIAAAFIGTGYQLYSVIIDDGSEARLRASASNAAYSLLRKYSPQATNPCTAVTATPTPTLPSGTTLTNSVVSVTFACPFGTTSSTTKVTVSVKYGNPQQEVIHGTYVND